MVTPGSLNYDRQNVTAYEIAQRTVLALSRTVPPALVGVTVFIFCFTKKKYYNIK